MPAKQAVLHTVTCLLNVLLGGFFLSALCVGISALMYRTGQFCLTRMIVSLTKGVKNWGKASSSS